VSGIPPIVRRISLKQETVLSFLSVIDYTIINAMEKKEPFLSQRSSLGPFQPRGLQMKERANTHRSPPGGKKRIGGNHMDPITEAIIAALTAGALSGLTETGKAGMIDAYQSLKRGVEYLADRKTTLNPESSSQVDR
jgi:hypothetical protein